MTQTRRHILLAAPAILLAACNATPQQIESDATIISTGLQGVLPALQALGVQIPPAVSTTITATLAQIAADAPLIAAALKPDATLVQRFAAGVQALAGLVGPYLPQAATVGALVQAALALLPGVLALAGIAAAAKAPAMGATQARAVLKAGAR